MTTSQVLVLATSIIDACNPCIESVDFAIAMIDLAIAFHRSNENAPMCTELNTIRTALITEQERLRDDHE